MPVIINEFEVVQPGQEPAGGTGQAGQPPQRPLDLDREIERVVRLRAEREQRLEAD